MESYLEIDDISPFDKGTTKYLIISKYSDKKSTFNLILKKNFHNITNIQLHKIVINDNDNNKCLNILNKIYKRFIKKESFAKDISFITMNNNLLNYIIKFFKIDSVEFVYYPSSSYEKEDDFDTFLDNPKNIENLFDKYPILKNIKNIKFNFSERSKLRSIENLFIYFKNLSTITLINIIRNFRYYNHIFEVIKFLSEKLSKNHNIIEVYGIYGLGSEIINELCSYNKKIQHNLLNKCIHSINKKGKVNLENTTSLGYKIFSVYNDKYIEDKHEIIKSMFK